MGVNANAITDADVMTLAIRVRERATRVMGEQKASDLAEALARVHTPKAAGGGDRLATDAAAKLLATGKLRQAEKAYLELVAKRPTVDAYIGLARAQATLEDVPAALNALRDGAAQFARAGDRGSAVSLLAEAVTIAPTDLSAHRRLAAALANQGDMIGAVAEYARFVDVTNDSRRALIELAYGRETLGDLPGLAAIVDKVTGAPRAEAPKIQKREAAPLPKITPEPPRPAPAPKAAPDIRSAVMTAKVIVNGTPTKATTSGTAPKTTTTDAPTTRVLPTLTHTQETTRTVDETAAVDVLARAGVLKRLEKPAETAKPRPIDIEAQLSSLLTTGSGVEAAATAASRAALLTGAHDARATEAVLDAARRLLALGKMQSASDVLLDFIGHGFTDREAQRLLIEVDCALGRRDVAKEKCSLLSHAYRLDGHGDTAADVERLARIL